MKNNICYVALCGISSMPYFERYKSISDKSFEMIYWNRKETMDSNPSNYHEMHFPIGVNDSKWKKLTGYLRFRRYAKRILLKKNYSKIVLLTSNTALLFFDILMKKYKKNYVIDIRDYFCERNPIIYFVEKLLIKNSGLAVISSKAFTSFLPEHDYLVVHNSPIINKCDLNVFNELCKKRFNTRLDRRIVLSYIGSVRFFDQDKHIIELFKNDERFEIRYIGAGANYLKSICDIENVSNVYFHDRFPMEETLEYYKDTDIIINLYGNGVPSLDYALSNKLYYAAKLRMPILVCANTYMETIVQEYGLGFTFDFNASDVKDLLYDYYMNIDYTQFVNNCETFNSLVEQEDSIFDEKMQNFLD